jgi:hypothetical protein
MAKKIGRSTTGYPKYDPPGAKPMSDPQLDMRTWKPPVQPKIKARAPIRTLPIPLRPGAKRYFA